MSIRVARRIAAIPFVVAILAAHPASITASCLASGQAAVEKQPEPDPELILARLAAFDAAFLSKFSLTLQTQELADTIHTDLGWAAWKVHVASDGVSWLMMREQPVYTPASYGDPTGSNAQWSRSFEYDSDGLRLVWRNQVEALLAEPDHLGFFYERQLHSIDEKAQLVHQERGAPVVSLHVPGDEAFLVQLWHLLWATGRGYARAIDRIRSAGVDADGLLALVADGRDGVEHGVWTLSIERDSGFLVRRAKFIRTGSTLPMVEITTSGTEWCAGGVLAKLGTIMLAGGGEAGATSIALERLDVGAGDPARFEWLRDRIRRQPPRDAVIIDERDPAETRVTKPGQ